MFYSAQRLKNITFYYMYILLPNSLKFHRQTKDIFGENKDMEFAPACVVPPAHLSLRAPPARFFSPPGFPHSRSFSRTRFSLPRLFPAPPLDSAPRRPSKPPPVEPPPVEPPALFSPERQNTRRFRAGCRWFCFCRDYFLTSPKRTAVTAPLPSAIITLMVC